MSGCVLLPQNNAKAKYFYICKYRRRCMNTLKHKSYNIAMKTQEKYKKTYSAKSNYET